MVTGKSEIRMIGAGPVFNLLLFLLLSACSDPARIEPEKVVYHEPKAETCQGDPDHRYHILVPGEHDPSQKLPLVIVLDAHGDGRMAASKFQPAVRYFPCLVAGSDLIRNHYTGFESAIMQLITDIGRKFPVDRQHIVVSGFSGGARMAYHFVLRHPVKGVLMSGAGPGGQIPDCPVYTISGMGDFNFAEQYRHPDMGSFSDDRFTSDYFHGIHEWPQPEQLSDALVFLLRDLGQLDALRKKRSHELLQRADSLERSGDPIMAWKALEKAAKLSVRQKPKREALHRGRSLLQQPAFLEAIRTLESDLNAERQLQQGYSESLFTKDTTWWKSEITGLKQDLAAHPGGLERDHYLRIRGFIGILLYTAVNHTIQTDPGHSKLEELLTIYAFTEPENPDPYYFRALHAYRTGDRQSCMENLEKALDLGFSDPERLRREFPELQMPG